MPRHATPALAKSNYASRGLRASMRYLVAYPRGAKPGHANPRHNTLIQNTRFYDTPCQAKPGNEKLISPRQSQVKARQAKYQQVPEPSGTTR
eukprot:1354782-Pyramimonas_sp.AAC.1